MSIFLRRRCGKRDFVKTVWCSICQKICQCWRLKLCHVTLVNITIYILRWIRKKFEVIILLRFADVIDRNEMVLRAITDTCDVQNCNYTIKPLSAPGNFRESYVLSFYLKPFYLIPLSYNRDTKLLIWTEFKTLDRHRNLRKTLHLHSIPIRNPRKFHSLTITPNKKFSSRKFFQLLHPANLHATWSWIIFDLQHYLNIYLKIRYICKKEREIHLSRKQIDKCCRNIAKKGQCLHIPINITLTSFLFIMILYWLLYSNRYEHQMIYLIII